MKISRKSLLPAALVCCLLLANCKPAGEDDSGRVPNRVPVSGQSAAGDGFNPDGETTGEPGEVSRNADGSYSYVGGTSGSSRNSTSQSGNSVRSGVSVQPGVSQVPPPNPDSLTVVKSFSPGSSSTSRLTYTTPVLNLGTKGLGYVRLRIKNTSAALSVTVFFITTEDNRYSTAKSVQVGLDIGNTAYKDYIADLSDCYGFTGNITNIKVESSVIFDGSMTLERLDICKGGALPQPFTISAMQTVATRAQIKSLSGGSSFFPDGIMGILPAAGNTFDFISSSPLNSMKSVAIFNGTANQPTQRLVVKDVAVQNTPNGYKYQQYNYVSTGQVYRFSGNECLTILHLERYFNKAGSYSDGDGTRPTGQDWYIASLALGYSPDNGRSWFYAGEVATHECESIHQYYGMSAHPINGKPMSRDIGNGPFIIKDGYLYVYLIDHNAQYAQTISVMRAPLNDTIAAARAKSTARNTTLFKKYHGGSFSQPGINGKSDTIIDGECPPNFMSIIYSTHLKKYILARCAAPQYSSNLGDIVMNISADPLNFKGANYYVDASLRGQNYPTLMGTTDSNPAFETGKSVYLFYVDAEASDAFLWDIANIVRREITFD